MFSRLHELVCCSLIQTQCRQNRNNVMLVGSRNNLTKLASQDLTLTLSMETIKPAVVVRDLGLWLDTELSLRQHVAKVTSACF